MWRMNVSALIQNSSSPGSGSRQSRGEDVTLEAHVLGLGRREGGEVVGAGQRRRAGVERARGRAGRPTHHARRRAARALRERRVRTR